MKKILLLSISALLCFSACKKQTQSQPIQTPKSYIIGDWKSTLSIDTSYYRTGGKSFTYLSTGDDLNFISDSIVSTGSGSYGYTLIDGIFFTNGTYTITKISDTQIHVDHHYFTSSANISSEWLVTYYSKQ